MTPTCCRICPIILFWYDYAVSYYTLRHHIHYRGDKIYVNYCNKNNDSNDSDSSDSDDDDDDDDDASEGYSIRQQIQSRNATELNDCFSPH